MQVNLLFRRLVVVATTLWLLPNRRNRNNNVEGETEMNPKNSPLWVRIVLGLLIIYGLGIAVKAMRASWRDHWYANQVSYSPPVAVSTAWAAATTTPRASAPGTPPTTAPATLPQPGGASGLTPAPVSGMLTTASTAGTATTIVSPPVTLPKYLPVSAGATGQTLDVPLDGTFVSQSCVAPVMDPEDQLRYTCSFRTDEPVTVIIYYQDGQAPKTVLLRPDSDLPPSILGRNVGKIMVKFSKETIEAMKARMKDPTAKSLPVFHYGWRLKK
jgi:hypothetical protein